MKTISNTDACAQQRKSMFAVASLIAIVAAGSAHAQTQPAAPTAPAPAAPAASAPVATAPAASAAAPPSLSEVVVTGTLFRGIAPVGAPVTRVTRDEIDKTGLVSTSDILHVLPQVTSLGAGEVYGGTNQNASLNTDRDSAINLRGLGPQATLVLLDGRRTPDGGTTGQLFDPTSLPSIALSGIDILTGGASATYGSDAIAGVVNLTLRKNFEGLQAQATYGDGIGYDTEDFGAIWGHKWDGGSVMIAAENSNGTELLETARPNLYNCAPGGVNACSVNNPTYGNVKFTGTGAPYYSVPANTTGTGITTSQLTPGATYFNPAQDAAILPKTNRNSFVWNAQQEVTDYLHLWAEGYFTQKNDSFPLGQLSFSGTVPSTNPGYITPAAPFTGKETAYTALDGYVGPEFRSGLERAYQAAAGADVILPAGWAFDVYGEHNSNYERVVTSGLNSSIAGTTVSPVIPALACTTPGLCFDPFGPYPTNAAAIAQMVGASYTNYWQTEDVINGNFEGPVFALPGGEVKLAFGGEFQNNSLKVLSENTTASPTTSVLHIAGNFTSPRTVDSVFAEAIIPVIGSGNRLPLFESFTIDAAGRFDHYSDVGNTSNPKVSFDWKPISDLSITGEFGTSFRAPTLCDTNPDCTGTVMSSTTQIPGYDVVTLLGGNTSVKPETATTIDAGAKYRPSQLPGLTATVDYYSIDYENVISTPGSGLTKAQFNSALYASVVNKNPTAAYLQSLEAQTYFVAPTTFNINAPGAPLVVINGERFNSGAIRTHGIDFTSDYRWNNGLGSWDAGISGTYLIDYDYEVFPGLPFVEEANKYNYPTRWRFRTNTSWTGHNLTAVAYVNYTGGYDNNTGTNGIPLNTKVNPFVTLDLTLLYKLPDTHMLDGFANHATVSVSFINLTNAAPPYALTSTTQEYDAQQASPLGRIINMTVKKAF